MVGGGKINRDFALGIASFAAYDLWMLLFPLQGLALLSTAGPRAIAFWLVPHVLTFSLLSLIPNERYFDPISKVALLLTCVFTALFPYAPQFHGKLLLLLGITSALAMVRTASLLCHHQRPWKAAAWALIFANILLSLILALKIPNEILFIGLGLFLLIGIFGSLPASAPSSSASMFRYFPFIFSFYLLSALLYIVLMPHYVEEAIFLGVENLFYVATLLLAARLLPKEKDLVLALGIGGGIFAISFFHSHVPLSHNLSMYAIQIAVGFVDLFCLYLFLTGENYIANLAKGFACVFWGVTASLPLYYLARESDFILIGGNIILGISLLLFYFTERRRNVKKIVLLTKNNKAFNNQETKPKEVWQTKSAKEEFAQKLSAREKEVFQLTLEGKSIKEIAEEIGISISSVKTYLQRVYKKADVRNKQELIDKFS